MISRVFLSCLFILQQGVACSSDGGSLAVSAGAPVGAAVRGRITQCGEAVETAEVLLAVQQDRNQQARPVNTRVGPQATARDGGFLFDVSPPFAIPGAASMQLVVTANGATDTIPGGLLDLRMGVPPRDTTRFDVDLGAERGTC